MRRRKRIVRKRRVRRKRKVTRRKLYRTKALVRKARRKGQRIYKVKGGYRLTKA